MKATGIVRRIDDLGRVVIPKETAGPCEFERATLWKFSPTATGGVVFKKYSLMGGLGDFSRPTV